MLNKFTISIVEYCQRRLTADSVDSALRSISYPLSVVVNYMSPLFQHRYYLIWYRKLLQASIRANKTGHFVWVASDSWGAKSHPVRDQEFAAVNSITVLPQRTNLDGKLFVYFIRAHFSHFIQQDHIFWPLWLWCDYTW